MVAKKVFVSKCSSFSILFSAISSCCFQLLLCIVFSVYSQHLWWWDCWEKWHQGYLPSLTHLLMLLNWCWWDERSVAWIKRRAFIFMVISFYFYHWKEGKYMPMSILSMKFFPAFSFSKILVWYVQRRRFAAVGPLAKQSNYTQAKFTQKFSLHAQCTTICTFSQCYKILHKRCA